MKHDAAVVFPHQLFENHPSISPQGTVYLVEDDRFFTDFAFHQKKLLLHRASMRFYEDYLGENGYPVVYCENQPKITLERLFAEVHEQGIGSVRMADVTDHILEERIRVLARRFDITVAFDRTPAFLTPVPLIMNEFGEKKHYLMDRFYRKQRVRLDILMEDTKPRGGKWNYDVLNRKPIPHDERVPRLPVLPSSGYVKEAARYVNERFPDNPGSTDGFFYPVTHAMARTWLEDFLTHKLARFGTYEDAIREGDAFMYHSVLSPSLNTGLITPDEVVQKTLLYADVHDVPLNSLEGFIRQVIGWREFIRAVYLCRGEEERKSNFWGHRRRIPPSFYSGTTGLPPVDGAIKNVLSHAFTHHIERLMVLGNIMCLCGIRPDECYRWFMELFIDAYDWVMVPNVYGMSQYADGGVMSTKPYISGSNYLRRMSDIPEGEWCTVWDGLFWRFIEKNRPKIVGNYRMNLMLSNLDKKSEEDKSALFSAAEEYLGTLGE